MRWWTGARQRQSRWTRLGTVAACATLLASCGEDDPTSLGSDQRTHPDTLRVVELTEVVTDSVFHLPVSLGASPTGQIGAQQLGPADSKS